MALRIKPISAPGEEVHIAPETMEILMELGTHRQQCEQCDNLMSGKGGQLCNLGAKIAVRLQDRPDCEFVPDEK